MSGALLVLNAGSSSLKWSVFLDDNPPHLLLRGQFDGMLTSPRFVARSDDRVVAEQEWDRPIDHKEAVEFLFQWGRAGVLGGRQITAVGHRVVHGGTAFAEPTRLDAATIAELEALTPLAPLHQPHNVAAIKIVAGIAPSVPQVACFDTAFHRAQPEVAQSFALPRRYAREGVRRYGFHGLSYEYIAAALPAIDQRAAAGRTVVAHLGNGASLCAMDRGRSVATTMGFTTLDGLVMGTRCGSIDPGVLLYLINHHGMTPRDLEQLLYEQSGLLGVSEISSDMRDLLASHDTRAAEAIDLFTYRVGRELGSLAAALGGIDALVFTGGIGEHAAWIRARVCRSAAWLGLELDAEGNASDGPCISTPGSTVAAWVIPTNEELMIALHTGRVLTKARSSVSAATRRDQTGPNNPLRALPMYGQAVWLDYIRRSLLTGGELRRLVEQDDVRGVTSNPAIFEKAIAGSSDYRDLLESPAARTLDAKSLYEQIAVRDVQDAADALRPVYQATARRDGYVSLEVSPLLAHDTPGTLSEARRLWQTVGCENLMIKVPATAEGIAALRELISEGINVNATLLFALDAYEQVADAYITGLETFVARGGDPKGVASVASFFVSRIDTAIDSQVAERLERAATPRDQALLRALGGKVAVANAKLAFERYQDIVAGRRWQALAAIGAQTQRLLWASTATKNPAYRDVLYVEQLIGPDTVTTIPPATLEAFRDHGRPRASLAEDLESARDTMDLLAESGISMKTVTDALLDDGVQLFANAFDELLKAVDRQRRTPGDERINRLTYWLPEAMDAAVRSTLAEWRTDNKVRRLWGRDATLWTGRDEAQWLGWLGITNDQVAHLQRLIHVRDVARDAGLAHVLLLGMGGSSLCPEVMKMTFGTITGYPELHVLDSTDPAQVKAIEQRIDLKQTLFIVSSKSGSTLEPNIFEQYFFERVKALVGPDEAGRRFIAITDPGSKLQHVAEAEGFRHIFFGWPDIGGRYSALSDFGLVPAAIMGVDVAKCLGRTEQMVCACMPSVPVDENPGVVLGAVLGVAASRFGRDKVTIVTSPGIGDLGAWLEQLVAESTGKEGKGLLPIDREALGKAEVYGGDRIFVYLRLLSAPDTAQDAAVDALQRVGQPVVRISVDEPYDVGQEFFRWEIATAVAGAILGIHPFDQPDVEASKNATRKLTADYEKSGSLPSEMPIFAGNGIQLFTEGEHAAALAARVGGDRSLTGYLRAHIAGLGPGDYFALLAYVEMNDAHNRVLQAMRHEVRDAMRVATCVEFGPRFLHSTGQFYKGGPNTGVFLQITCDDSVDVPVPGHRYTFGVVKAAQARGDLQVLVQRERRALRAHLGADVGAGLATLQAAMAEALLAAHK